MEAKQVNQEKLIQVNKFRRILDSFDMTNDNRAFLVTLVTRLIDIDYIDDAARLIEKLSQLENDTNYVTEEQLTQSVSEAIANVIADAPEDLNTLKEISDYISSDKTKAAEMTVKLTNHEGAIGSLNNKIDALNTFKNNTDIKIKALENAKLTAGNNITIKDNIISAVIPKQDTMNIVHTTNNGKNQYKLTNSTFTSKNNLYIINQDSESTNNDGGIVIGALTKDAIAPHSYTSLIKNNNFNAGISVSNGDGNIEIYAHCNITLANDYGSISLSDGSSNPDIEIHGDIDLFSMPKTVVHIPNNNKSNNRDGFFITTGEDCNEAEDNIVHITTNKYEIHHNNITVNNKDDESKIEINGTNIKFRGSASSSLNITDKLVKSVGNTQVKDGNFELVSSKLDNENNSIIPTIHRAYVTRKVVNGGNSTTEFHTDGTLWESDIPTNDEIDNLFK